MPTKFSNTACTAMALLLCAPFGCKARELGSNFADAQSATVDNTWVTAIDTCWPAMSHQDYSIEAIKHYLADPLHFRAAFGVYAYLSDDQLRVVVAAPVRSAPMPDTSVLMRSQTPILTRLQALAGFKATNSFVPDSDSLCAIQPGLPVGFK